MSLASFYCNLIRILASFSCILSNKSLSYAFSLPLLHSLSSCCVLSTYHLLSSIYIKKFLLKIIQQNFIIDFNTETRIFIGDSRVTAYAV